MANLDALLQLQHCAAALTSIPLRNLAQIRKTRGEILPRRYVPQVIVVAIGARDHIAARLKRPVGQDRDFPHAYRSKRTGVGSEPAANLFRMSGPEGSASQNRCQLGLA